MFVLITESRLWGIGNPDYLTSAIQLLHSPFGDIHASYFNNTG